MTDNISSSLLTLSIFSGGVATDLIIKGDVYSGGFFIVLTGALIFAREYFKVA